MLHGRRRSEVTRCDVIMLAASKDKRLIDMTQAAIDSLHKSETDHSFRCLVVESHRLHAYNGALLLMPAKEFNYNRFMNKGLELTGQKSPADWICLANNDLIFHDRWFSAILESARADPKLGSFSPWNLGAWPHGSSKILKAYGVGGVVTGWCLVARRSLFDRVKLDERVNFWCSDNCYEDELKRHGVHHALIRDSHVTHLGGVTLFSESSERIGHLTAGQAQIYREIQNEDRNPKPPLP
jgi:hypothetical protein